MPPCLLHSHTGIACTNDRQNYPWWTRRPWGASNRFIEMSSLSIGVQKPHEIRKFRNCFIAGPGNRLRPPRGLRADPDIGNKLKVHGIRKQARRNPIIRSIPDLVRCGAAAVSAKVGAESRLQREGADLLVAGTPAKPALRHDRREI